MHEVWNRYQRAVRNEQFTIYNYTAGHDAPTAAPQEWARSQAASAGSRSVAPARSAVGSARSRPTAESLHRDLQNLALTRRDPGVVARRAGSSSSSSHRQSPSVVSGGSRHSVNPPSQASSRRSGTSSAGSRSGSSSVTRTRTETTENLVPVARPSPWGYGMQYGVMVVPTTTTKTDTFVVNDKKKRR